MAAVLLVQDDAYDRRQIAAWLEEGGNDVMLCPGPQGPDYVCIGSRGEACPLVRAADVIVLDLELQPDVAMRGTPAWELLLTYYEAGAHVVALSDDDDPVHPLPDDRVAILRRPPGREELLATVRDLARRAPAGVSGSPRAGTAGPTAGRRSRG